MTAYPDRRARIVLAALLLTSGAGACSGGGEVESPSTITISDGATTTAAGITEAAAIEIAREQVEADDPEFDFEGTRPVVIPSGDTYDVAFPEEEPTGPGGEPHVVVDRSTGEVIETYLTR